MLRRVSRNSLTWFALLALAIQSGCAVNPATGKREFMLVSERQEIAMGRNADPQIVAAFGLHPDPDLQEYITDLGSRLAALSERPQLPWTFRVLDDPTINAFALPGGFNYVTRGIMVYLDSEAELVSVMGHELGHVTARHGAHQMSQQQLAQIGVVAGVVFVPELEDFAGVALAGLQLLFLKFSRDDESEADRLGLRYMSAAGYDPNEMPNVYEMLDRVSGAGEGGRLPVWLSTHPDPVNRKETIRRLIDSLPRPLPTVVGRDAYYGRIDGMVFGPDPREGYFRGRVFYHPDLALTMAFPAEWTTANQRSAVLAQSPGQDAMMQMTLAEGESPTAAASDFLGGDGITGGPVREHNINGFRGATADFRASTQGGTLSGAVTFIADGGTVYQLLGFSTAERWSAYRDVVSSSVASFNRLTDATALAVRPLRLSIVTLDRAMTLREFSRAYPSQVSLDQLGLLNRAGPNDRMPAGRGVKRVVGGPLP